MRRPRVVCDADGLLDGDDADIIVGFVDVASVLVVLAGLVPNILSVQCHTLTHIFYRLSLFLTLRPKRPLNPHGLVTRVMILFSHC